MAETQFWLVSAPAETTKDDTRRRLADRTSSKDLSENFAFDIPDLKVGTLDALVALSDDMNKVDTFMESVVSKLAHYMADLLAGQKGKLEENLLADGRTLDGYFTKFHWDTARYNVGLPVRELCDMMSQQMTKLETEMKAKIQAYNKSKGNLQAIERKANGSLLIRSLNELVEAKHFVLNSEYIVTLLVVVPKFAYKEWERMYETLVEFVVPRSSEFITEDTEYGLFTVTVLRKMVDDFRNKAREQKFIVRDFEYNPDEVTADEAEKTALKTDITKKYNVLINWCKVSFSEAFSTWIHLKALRVFVESVLRYGLPPNFQATILKVQKKKSKSVRQALGQLYGHLDKNSPVGSSAEIVDIPGLTSTTEYFPYVNFNINLEQFTNIGQ